MNSIELKKLPKDEILNFIRHELSLKDPHNWIRHEIDPTSIHKRFEMSGYEGKTGECTLWNQEVLNTFAYLGIYDYTTFFFLDFYKGDPTIYYNYWCDLEHVVADNLSGYGTTELIYEVFKLTIFSGKRKRRRD